jgi:hypothetical protein
MIKVLNPADVNISEMGLHPLTLKFKDKQLEKKYIKERQKNVLLGRILYFLILFIFGVYSLVDMFILEDDMIYNYARVALIVGFLVYGILLLTQ